MRCQGKAGGPPPFCGGTVQPVGNFRKDTPYANGCLRYNNGKGCEPHILCSLSSLC